MDLEALAIAALDDFAKAAALAGGAFDRAAAEVVFLPAPHRQPSSLPKGRIAVYAFFHGERALKVGKAGPKTLARYTSQHYRAGSAPSTLAASLLKRPSVVGLEALDPQTLQECIRANTSRVNFLLPDTCPREVLSLLEAFLHVRWRPAFEGRAVSEA